MLFSFFPFRLSTYGRFVVMLMTMIQTLLKVNCKVAILDWGMLPLISNFKSNLSSDFLIYSLSFFLGYHSFYSLYFGVRNFILHSHGQCTYILVLFFSLHTASAFLFQGKLLKKDRYWEFKCRGFYYVCSKGPNGHKSLTSNLITAKLSKTVS